MDVFFSYIKLFLFVALVSLGYFFLLLWNKMPEYIDMDKFELADFKAEFKDDKPLAPNKYVQALAYPSLKDKSEELRQLYNQRVQAVDIVEERLRLLRNNSTVSARVEKMVSGDMIQVRKLNSSLLKQIDNITEFAESLYASDIVRRDVQEDREKAERISEMTERLMQAVEVPHKGE